MQPNVPYDIEAEEAVLACMMVPGGWEQIPELAAMLTPQDFYREKNGWVFAAALDLWRAHQEPNQITVAFELAKADRLEQSGGQVFLADIIRRLPTSIGAAGFYGEIVRELARKREVIGALHALTVQANDGQTRADDLVSNGLQQLIQLAERRPRVLTRSIGDILDGRGDERDVGVTEEMEAFIQDPGAFLGIPTGWSQLDEWTRGLQIGRVYTAVGDTSVGKSFLMQFIAWSVARAGHPVAIFSTEMPQREIGQRLVFMEAGLDRKAIESTGTISAAMAERLRAAQDRLHDLPLYICDVGKIPLATLEGEARRLASTKGVVGLFIDHIQHIRVPGKKGVELIEEITASTKGLALNADLFVFQVSHINRESAKNGISIHSGKGGSSIEQDSDVIFTLEAVAWDKETGWQPQDEVLATAFQARNGFQYIRLTAGKGRSGGKGWDVRMLDWGMGGRFQPMEMDLGAEGVA